MIPFAANKSSALCIARAGRPMAPVRPLVRRLGTSSKEGMLSAISSLGWVQSYRPPARCPVSAAAKRFAGFLSVYTISLSSSVVVLCRVSSSSLPSSSTHLMRRRVIQSPRRRILVTSTPVCGSCMLPSRTQYGGRTRPGRRCLEVTTWWRYFIFPPAGATVLFVLIFGVAR